MGLLEARGYLLERLTEHWPTEALLDLLQRLDLMFEILQPVKDTATRGEAVSN